MNLRPEEIDRVPETVESLRLELERCQRELGECHRRLEQQHGLLCSTPDSMTGGGASTASEQLARGQIETLTRTLDALAKESVPDRLVEHVVRAIAEQLDAHSCSVWWRYEAIGMAGFECAYERDHEKFVTRSDVALTGFNLWINFADFWPVEVFRTGKYLVIADIREMPLSPWKARLVSQGVITMLVMPMIAAGQVEAVIGIRFTDSRTFSDEEIALAQALANQAMLAMQLTRLSAQSCGSAVLDERNRIAREIHDTVAHGLTGVIVQLEAAEDATLLGLPHEASEHLGRARSLARESLNEARRSVQALRPQALEEGDLCGALSTLLSKLTTGTNMKSVFELQGIPRPLPPGWDEHILRIGQEALTNALRHAQADHFTAGLVYGSDGIRLKLNDTGRGFDTEDEHGGFGLLGMKERVSRMGGQLDIQSRSDRGTAISIMLPLPISP
ncbi:MAG: sensor histidine kinase [Rhodanobacter sp.]